MDASSNCREQIVATFEWALNGLNLSSCVHFLEIESLVLSNVAFHDTKLCYLLVYLVSTGISFCSKKKEVFWSISQVDQLSILASELIGN